MCQLSHPGSDEATVFIHQLISHWLIPEVLTPPESLPSCSQRGRGSPQVKTCRFLQQEAVPRGIRNMGQQGRQRRAPGEKVSAEQRPEEKRGQALPEFGGRSSQAKRTARANTPKWERAQHVGSTTKRSVCLKQKREGRCYEMRW